VFNECNLKLHYNIKRAEKYEHLQGQIRKHTVSDLRKKLTSQQTFITKSTNDSEIAVKASYAVSEIIAKRLKPYADDEVVKECLEVVGDITCPEKKNNFKYQSVAIYSLS
jgi:ribosomal protein S4